jgi:drug/metabolite transporter (DMT)-like permease
MRRALLLLAAGAVAFGLAAVFTKLCEFPPAVIASFRMILGGIVFLPAASRALAAGPFPARRLFAAALPGLLLGLHFQFWIAGIKTTTAAAGTFIFAVNPVFFALVERAFYRRALPRFALPCLAAIVVGGAWLVLAGGSGAVGGAGNLLCFISTLLFVVYIVASERVSGGIPHGLYLCVVYLSGGLLTLPIAAARGALAAAPWGNPSAYLWLGAVVLFPTVIGHGSLAYGVRFFSPLVVSFFTLFEPVLATLFALLLLGEAPAPREIPAFAVFLVATAAFLLLRFRRATPRRPAASSSND